MARGYSPPLSPTGSAGLVPPPPWHYAGVVLVVDYMADADAVAETLPPGLAPSLEVPGSCSAYFAEWQFATDGAQELLAPARSQYREFFVTVRASLDGREVHTCPYIWVDQDSSLVRGWIQGFPKKLGTIHVTRSLDLEGVAANPLRPGSRLAGACSSGGHRLAEAVLTLDARVPDGGPADSLPHPPLVNLRMFPTLERGLTDIPTLLELVTPIQRNPVVGDVWEGEASLVLHPAPGEELDSLRPLHVGRARRYASAFTVDDLEVVRRLTPERAANSRDARA